LTPNRFKVKYYFFFLGLFAFFAVLAIPIEMPLSAHKLSAIVALMAIWWVGEAVPIPVTALLPLVLFPLLGVMSAKEIAPNYANHLVFLFFGGFSIALAMEKWGLHKRIALNIILAVGSNVERTILGFMLATGFLSMWISNTATVLMMLPVAMAVVKELSRGAVATGIDNAKNSSLIESSLGCVLMLGIAYSASIGGISTLIGTPPNVVLAGLFKNYSQGAAEIPFGQWMVFALPLSLIFTFSVWMFLCRYASDIPFKQIEFKFSREIVSKQVDKLGALSKQEKFVAWVFGATAALWIFRKPLNVSGWTIPGWSQWFTDPGLIQDSTVSMAMVLLLFCVPLTLLGEGVSTKDKEIFALDWKTIETKMPWGILLLFGGGFALAAGFGKTGLDKWIGSQLSGIFELPVWTIIFVVCFSVTFLTELTSNTATATMILPILGALSVKGNIDPIYLMFPAALAASFAFMLPVATPPNAIVFGSGWVTISKMAKVGVVVNIIGTIVITLFTVFWLPVIFD
jgi:solute carrier family 13 (sodium-dependent dicarboxylate transporter), member 2/3/5